MSKSLLTLHLVLLLVPGFLHAADVPSAPPATAAEFEKNLRDNFQRAVDAANQEAESKLSTLRQTYDKFLENAGAEFIAAGKSEEAALVQTERERIAANDPFADNQIAAASLGKVREERKRYQAATNQVVLAKKRRLDELVNLGTRSLEDYARQLARQGKGAEALALQKSLEAWRNEFRPAPVVAGPKVENLLKNGDLSEGLRGWQVESWAQTGDQRLDEEVLFNNRPTLLLENKKPDNNMANQIIRVQPNTRYRISAFIKTENVVYTEKGNDGGCIGIRGTYERSEPLPQTMDWRKVSFDFNSGERREVEIGPHLGWHASTVTGKAWFAEIVLEQL